MFIDFYRKLAGLLLISGISFNLFAQFSAQTITGINSGDFSASNVFAAWGDYDNDGDLDLFRLGESQPRLNVNGGSNNFSGSYNLETHGSGYHGGVWADMDNDGNIDLVYTSYGNGMTPIYRNNGNGTFTIVKQFGRSHYGNLDVADIDLDGDLDVVASGTNWNLSGSDHGVKIFRNDGGWNFTHVYANQLSNVYGSTGQGSTVRFGDFNRDGLPDIVLAGSTTGSLTNGACRTEVYRNTGSGFSLMYSGIAVANARIDIGDYNSDGWLDFAVTGGLDGPWTANGQVYRNNTDGTFAPTAISGRTDGSIAFCDFDNDGDLDLNIQGVDGSYNHQIYRNDGSSVFTATSQISFPSDGLGTGTSVWGDYDNDNKPDLFCIGSRGGTAYAAILKNGLGGPGNIPPTAPTGMTQVIMGADVDLQWSPATDEKTASSGLYYNVMVGTTPGGINIVAPNANPATGFRRIPKIGNAWGNNFFKLKNLAPGVYYWQVQTIDNSFAGSSFANGGSFTIPPPAPTVTTPVNYCRGDVASALTATPMAGGSLRWYTVPTGGTGSGTAPTPATTTAGTTIYYVSQVVNAIEGPRASIVVNVYDIPALPTTTSVSYCVGDVASSLTATGSGGTLNWYTVPTGGTASGTAPTPSTSTAGVTNYYVSETVNGCEGPRETLTVTVYPIPSGPAVTSTLIYCYGDVASPLSATPDAGGSLNWWGTNSSGGTASGTAPTPSTTVFGTTLYYVTQVVNGCESTPRTPINVNVRSAPNLITNPSAATICEGGNTIFSVFATGSTLTYQWQISTNGGGSYSNLSNGGVYSDVNTKDLSITGATVTMNGYYYRCIITGYCNPSATTTGAMLTVNSLPAITGQPVATTICAGGNTSFNVTATGTGLVYQWQYSANGGGSYSNVTDNAIYSGSNTPTLNLTSPTVSYHNYYYRCIVSGTCSPAVTSGAAVSTVNGLPTINSNPNASTICEGGNTSFSISAQGTGITYQWEVSTNSGGSYSPLSNGGVYSNVTMNTLNITGATATMNGYWYRCVVNGTCSPAATSFDAILTVNTLPSISTQPANSTICLGTNTSFSVTATGTGISSYQWQVSFNGGGSYNNVSNVGIYSGANTATLTITGASQSFDNFYYRCVVGGTCTPAAVSSPGILTINELPNISTDPSPTSVCAGGNTSFTVDAFGAGITYQWEVSTDGGGSFSNLSNGGIYSNVNTSTLNITGAGISENNNFYRCTVSGTCSPSATSNEVPLTVRALPAISAQPVSQTVCLFGNTSFSVTATGVTTYQWQMSPDGVSYSNLTNGGNFSNVNASSLSITGAPSGLNGNYFRCIVSGSCTPAVTSDGVTLTISSAPSITTQPSPVSICSGDNVNFTISASGDNLTYQWQESSNGTSYTNITNGGIFSGATSASLDITGATVGRNGYYYRCVVTGSCAPAATSNGVILTVGSLPSITTHPTAKTICTNDFTDFSVTATGGGLTYQWQVSTNGGADYSDITAGGGNYAGFTSATLGLFNIPASFNSYLYRCVVNGSCNPPAVSNGAQLTVNAPPSVTSHPASSTICSGDNTSFSVSVSDIGFTFQWQESTNGGSSFNNVSDGGIFSGTTTGSLTLTGATASENGYLYRCVISAGCGSVNSNTALLTVNSIPAVSSSLTGTACSGVAQNFVITSSLAGTTYSWDRAAVPGISNGAVTGQTGSVINESLVNTTGSSVDVTYIITPTANGCTGASVNRVVTVNIIPSVPVVTNVEYCHGVTAVALTATPDAGGTLNWYGTNSTGGTPSPVAPVPSTASVGVNNYYVSQTVNGCESSRSSIAVTVIANPASPAVTVPSNYCVGSAASSLIATPDAGGALNWYGTNSTGGTPSPTAPVPSTAAAGTTVYYVSQTVNTCESSRSSIPVTVIAVPLPPTVSDITYCQNTTAAALMATTSPGGVLRWYGTNATGGTSSGTAPVPSTTTVGVVTYYVSQIVNSCESSRAAINVTIITTLAAPSVTSPVMYCQNASASPLIATPAGSAVLQWYGTNASGGTASLIPSTPLTNASGSFTYYVSQKENGCESPRSPITVTINPLPTVDAGPDRTVSAGSSVTLNGIGNATSYTWNNGVTNGVPFTISAAGSGYYVVTGTLGTCTKKDSMAIFVTQPNLPEIAIYYQSLQYFSGSNVDIGDATVLQGPYRYTFRINNQGSVDLNIGTISISGANSSSFNIDQSLLDPSLKADSSTTFDLIFNPADTGAVSAKITILSDDQDEATYEINIAGYSKRIVPSLVFLPIGDLEYGSSAIIMTASATNGKPVTFTTSTPSLVSLAGNMLTPNQIGDAVVEASIPGDDFYEPVVVQQIVKIRLPEFALLGPDYMAESVLNAYQIYPYKPQFKYQWTYLGNSLGFTTADTLYQIVVFAGSTTTDGDLFCTIYSSTGDSLGTVVKAITINHISGDAPALKSVNCPPASSDVSSCYIKQFDLETISNVSTYNNSGITDFTQAPVVTELFLGETYSATLLVHGDSMINRGVAIWIDFDNNSTFTEEEYIIGDFTTDTVIDINNIRIPNQEAYIGYRRLRVKVKELSAFANSQSCVEDGERGEAEDYLVNLKSRLDIKGSDFMTPNNDGKNDCFVIRGVNPRSQVRTLQIFDVMGNIIYTSDFYENDWCGIVTEGNGKGKMVPKGTYFYIFQTEETVLKSYIEVTY